MEIVCGIISEGIDIGKMIDIESMMMTDIESMMIDVRGDM